MSKDGRSSQDSSHLCMPEDIREKTTRHLARTRGDIERLQTLLENPHVYSIDVLRLLGALRRTLDEASHVVLRGHLVTHVATSHERGDSSELVDELMALLVRP
jgi:CsoR family transcriptional regulator, copper-sensing transcriptional repressor